MEENELLLDKEKLIAALTFVMLTSDTQPSTATYYDSGFRVDVFFDKGEVSTIVTPDGLQKRVDHYLSELTTQFLKQKILFVRMNFTMRGKATS